ncbi:MAG TPA: hypothetical protein DCQ29_01195 [Chitinophagaceae bacterium]|nr:hypothetical protein [Chitinophagaceae bacterium]
MKRILLSAALSLFLASMSFAQEKTPEELKAEREVLKAERKSEAYQERQKKLAELKDPGSTSVSSIDALAANSTTALLETKKNNELLPELYKRTVGETVDGVTDVTVKKPTIEELLAVSESILKTTKAVSASSLEIARAQADIKSAGMLKAVKATKSINYSKDVNSLLVAELAYQSKLIANLIATLKSSENL